MYVGVLATYHTLVTSYKFGMTVWRTVKHAPLPFSMLVMPRGEMKGGLGNEALISAFLAVEPHHLDTPHWS